ncbi:MAG: AraC family transcriptional regulator ligand-binding domain-containing protein [Gammaproteobacteria bacterium]
MRELSVAAGLVRGLVDFAVGLGASREQLLACAAIDAADLDDQDNRLPFATYAALTRRAKALCNQPALALLFAEAIDLSEVSIVGLLGHASETMLEAFAQLNRYGQLVVEVEVDGMGPGERFELLRSEGALWLVDHRRDANAFHELTECTFGRMICGTRRFGETPFVTEVHVTHADPGYRQEYQRVFRAPVTFNARWNAMRIDEAWLTHRIALSPKYVFGILSEHAQRLVRQLEQTRTTRGQVERLLLPILHTGTVSMELACSKLGMSRQTLFRKLMAENVTFEQVLDELRHTLALHYLSGKKVSVNETAYLVGFSDPASFSRAFKRWTGQSARSVRDARVD